MRCPKVHISFLHINVRLINFVQNKFLYNYYGLNAPLLFLFHKLYSPNSLLGYI